eukprot:372342_1
MAPARPSLSPQRIICAMDSIASWIHWIVTLCHYWIMHLYIPLYLMVFKCFDKTYTIMKEHVQTVFTPLAVVTIIRRGSRCSQATTRYPLYPHLNRRHDAADPKVTDYIKSQRHFTEIIQCIALVRRETVIEAICSSPLHTLEADESTDKSIKSCMVIYIHYSVRGTKLSKRRRLFFTFKKKHNSK